MSQLKELLDLEAQRIDADPDALDSVFHLRDRRRRDRRIRAAVVGLAAFAIVVVFFAGRIGEPRSLPATPTPAPALHRNGEIAVRADIGNGEGAIVQIDPTSGEETTLPVVAPPENLRFRGLHRPSEIDVWWSPDGTALAYNWDEDAYKENLHGDLWVLDIASGESRLIVPSCDCRELAWSPDGTAIAVARGHNLEVMKPDGSDATGIVPERIPWIHDPAWTPDGERILFASGGRRQRHYVIDRDGSNLTPLGEYRFDSRDIGNPVAFSPDGTRVAYFTWDFDPNNVGGSRQPWTVGVAVADFDGSNRRVVLEYAGECCDYDVFWFPYLGWSPDGTQLALTIDGTGEQPQGLYVMNADGTGLRLIREDVMGRPGWRPVS
jgi:dipeptidyl aminopeptidase/acylaminoacyl peptidase